MFKTLMAVTTMSLLIFNCSNASAQGRTFQLVSQASSKCVSLKSPDQNDGGGLVMQNCQNFPDFYVTATSANQASLQFQLNSHRFVCIFATENPVINPSGARAKVSARNCVGPTGVGLPGSLWNVRGGLSLGGDPHLIEKLKGVDGSGFCLRENQQTSEVELDVCQGVPEENWKLQAIP